MAQSNTATIETVSEYLRERDVVDHVTEHGDSQVSVQVSDLLVWSHVKHIRDEYGWSMAGGDEEGLLFFVRH